MQVCVCVGVDLGLPDSVAFLNRNADARIELSFFVVAIQTRVSCPVANYERSAAGPPPDCRVHGGDKPGHWSGGFVLMRAE